ncbi:ribonuclease HII [uncultured Jatrophihabitans sp.]|uniref:ribonuclease HII n=1 Tax=uncultured Jatrophihabitans sp. TaxID=1610747 RepID=UPI0035CC5171
MGGTTARAGLSLRLPRVLVRRDGPLGGYESALNRAGFGLVAGADEAGRGACAGPLVVAACILPPGRRGQIDGLDDSKLLTPATRERLFHKIVARAVAYSVIVVPAAEIDAYGLHVANLAGMRRAVGTLVPAAHYALTDGFPVPGLGAPATAVWKGDATIACIAAASILAKVTRDSIMTAMHDRWPDYEFAQHKGYITPAHAAALTARGPCPEHRRRYVNVRRALGRLPGVLDSDMLGSEPAEPGAARAAEHMAEHPVSVGASV